MADLQLVHPHAMSAKAKGKERAMGDVTDLETSLIPKEDELSPEFHPALALAKSVLGYRAIADDRIAGGRRGSLLDREKMEEEIKQRFSNVEYKIDYIFSRLNAARTTTNVAERMLNERFDILSTNLTSRIRPFLQLGEVAGDPTGSASSSRQLLSTYVAEPRSQIAGPDPLVLLRTLSRVDQERPPTQVSDAAQRAARELQRADEVGKTAVGPGSTVDS